MHAEKSQLVTPTVVFAALSNLVLDHFSKDINEQVGNLRYGIKLNSTIHVGMREAYSLLNFRNETGSYLGWNTCCANTRFLLQCGEDFIFFFPLSDGNPQNQTTGRAREEAATGVEIVIKCIRGWIYTNSKSPERCLDGAYYP